VTIPVDTKLREAAGEYFTRRREDSFPVHRDGRSDQPFWLPPTGSGHLSGDASLDLSRFVLRTTNVGTGELQGFLPQHPESPDHSPMPAHPIQGLRNAVPQCADIE
jgi:hypothetical protein